MQNVHPLQELIFLHYQYNIFLKPVLKQSSFSLMMTLLSAPDNKRKESEQL